MNYFLRLTLITMMTALFFQGAQTFADDVSEQTLKGVNYYVLKDSKTVQVELPFVVVLTLTKISSGYGAYVFGQLDTQSERPEIAELRNQYPGYKISYMAPDSFRSIVIDLGIGQTLTAMIPDSGANFFTAMKKLSTEDGEKILSRSASDQGPQVQINVESKKPRDVVVAQMSLDYGDICQELPRYTDKRTLGAALSSLTAVAADVLSDVNNMQLRQRATEMILDKCVQILPAGKVASMTDLLALPIKFQTASGRELADIHRIDYSNVEKVWNSSLKVVSQ